ncbi:uncharacterized protein METZ01_LOCUS209126 [marine metagenome]|uniref:Uncharacterized protein n=1 Tax=marine metagenome TaxID=408172 RepID=A0A382F0V7_9ZZZZ
MVFVGSMLLTLDLETVKRHLLFGRLLATRQTYPESTFGDDGQSLRKHQPSIIGPS